MSQVDNSHEHASAPQAQHTNFTLAFQDGRRGHDERGIGYTIRVRHLGDLAVTSGQIVACDPFWLDMAPQPFMTTVPLGHHPVLVSVVSFAGRDQRVACAMVRFASGEAVRWELALRPDWDAQTLAPGELVGYPVDAGMGCFMDYTTMEALLEEAGITDVDDWRLGPEGHWTPDGDTTEEWTALVNEVYDWKEDFGESLMDQVEDIWVEITASNGGNLIAFSSGWGDGGYASFFGYDAQDALVCLVTDFQVLSGAT